MGVAEPDEIVALDGRRGNNGWWKEDGGNEGDGSADEVEDAGEEDEEMGEQNVSEERRWMGQFSLVFWWDNWAMKLPRTAVKRPIVDLNESKWIVGVAELERVQPWPETLHVGQREHYALMGMKERMDDDRHRHIAFGQNHLDLNNNK